MSITMNGNLATDPATEALIAKIKGAVLELVLRRGPFSLFALLEREDAPGRWDVVASAPWLGTGRDGILIIAHDVTGHLSPQEAVNIARIVTLSPESDLVKSLQDVYTGTTNGGTAPIRLGASALGGVEIRQGYILTINTMSGASRLADGIA